MKRLTPYLLATLAWLIMSPANAQTTFGASVTNANGTLNTVLTWNSPGATGCTASGHANWTGAKPASGTYTMPPITQSGTYRLTLACTRAGDTTATLRWTAPTTSTDGSPLAKCTSTTQTGACLAQFNLYRRVGSQDMNGAEMTPLRDPNAVSRAFPGLGAGVHYFGVEVVNGDGVPSAMSNIASKTITAGTVENGSVTLTVNPIPAAPTAVTAT